MKVGFGYDIHPLVKERPLILGGIEIPHNKGLGGHSDADPVCHAIMDALLGGAALGDIGTHFPDTDDAYKNISSTTLLMNVVEKVRQEGYNIVNIDVTIIAESPRIGPYRSKIVSRLSELLNAQVSIKAKTNEGLGPEGRREAISVYAVACLEEST